jgi:hypothetical protein
LFSSPRSRCGAFRTCKGGGRHGGAEAGELK